MSLKRKLTQDDLRKAMSEHKKKLGVVKKIESPLARYTDVGQLMCVLCKITVRNEVVWPVHLNSKTHKENIALAKKTKLETDIPKIATHTFKRPTSPSQESSSNKKIKGILKTSSSQAASNLPSDFFDNNIKKSNGTVPSNTSVIMQKSENGNELANDKELKNVEIEEEREKDRNKDTSQTTLPEGFFDDPVLDAKVRNVEYKNPIEEEWEKFQKEIKEETAQSAQIIADDQEEATTERQLGEIEEQLRHWSRVMDLVKRKEQVQATDRKQKNTDEDVSSGDEAEFDEFLDWRAKNSYK
ncbi:zinc finger protein 830 [Hylaeus anthracinus]|uniref:zinc finger protein 830 n=1 Tax=Hylaeus volcanicus TaxID=313075 RepID=UPI0023B830B7|nr:zinc finger protein 830 [Hylaeus volcanicus]XP_053982709.1 zinc finger protein 830 [Hylaeus volcanicus]XP_053998428.1 zinc finger protein 830 [Hylaeus anthracinus]